MDSKKVLEWLYESDIVTDSCDGYSEPGYSTNKLVLFGDWNNINNKFCNHLEKYFELEWLDDWTACQSCCKAVRIQPNCYTWQPSYVWLSDCEIICTECLHDDIDLYAEWLEDFINSTNRCINSQSVNHDFMHDLGFELLDDEYNSGLHDGMNADPASIAGKLHKHYDNIVFYNNDTSQFYITFKAYVR